jgi:glycosyltransferase involved in cell wall biosynthesis
MPSRPHVLVDATAIPPSRAGVGRYLAELLPALDRRGEQLTIAAQHHDVEWISAACPSATVIGVSPRLRRRPLRLLWEQSGLPRLARRVRADLVFSPHYTLPLLSPVPVVATFHDATFFSHPELHERAKRLFFRGWIRATARRAAAILVPSASARDELAAHAGIPAELMTVAHHGVDAGLFHRPDAAEVGAAAARIGAQHWIAFLGTIEPRKNLGALVAAFGAVATDPAVLRAHPGLVLAISGGRGWDAAFDGQVAASPVADSIRVLGYLPDDLLAGFLGGAMLVAYPSLGEGFGMPVAEAMACGSAVLTTRALSLPEIGGDVALYSDPDAAALTTALRALLLDDDLRAAHAARGPERAAGFTWEASAELHHGAFVTAMQTRAMEKAA